MDGDFVFLPLLCPRDETQESLQARKIPLPSISGVPVMNCWAHLCLETHPETVGKKIETDQ